MNNNQNIYNHIQEIESGNIKTYSILELKKINKGIFKCVIDREYEKTKLDIENNFLKLCEKVNYILRKNGFETILKQNYQDYEEFGYAIEFKSTISKNLDEDIIYEKILSELLDIDKSIPYRNYLFEYLKKYKEGVNNPKETVLKICDYLSELIKTLLNNISEEYLINNLQLYNTKFTINGLSVNNLLE